MLNVKEIERIFQFWIYFHALEQVLVNYYYTCKQHKESSKIELLIHPPSKINIFLYFPVRKLFQKQEFVVWYQLFSGFSFNVDMNENFPNLYFGNMWHVFFSVVEYNETCFELDNDENACNTTNATCTKFNATEKRCLCTNDDVFIEAQNGCFHSMFTFFILI